MRKSQTGRILSRAELLTAAESCLRKGYFTRRWESHRLRPIEMLRRSVIAGLVETEEPDYGERAGSEMMTLAAERGLDIVGHNVYRCATNAAAIADIVTMCIRKSGESAWITAESDPSVTLDSSGNLLRRFLPVSTWNEERQASEIRSWYGIGSVCQFKLPQQLIVAVIGPQTGGRRHGYWSKALLHPHGSSLRFKLRARAKIEGFRDTWIPCYREEHDEIPRDKWIDSMNEDGVLKESLFVVNVPLPGELEAQKIRDMAQRKLEAISAIKALPDKQLSTCDGPLSPCPFRGCCWSPQELAPSGTSGFDAVG